VAWPRLRQDPALRDLAIESDRLWNRWLGYNYALQPGTDTFVVNAAVQTRTSHAFQTPRSRPLAELALESRAFAYTDTEYAKFLSEKRKQLVSQFGKWGPLRAPNAYSYIPTFAHEASEPSRPWQPSAAQRAEARANLPYLISRSFNRQLHDPYPFTFTYVRRPSYYAAFNHGRIRERQGFGLGLLWHDRFGSALQAVAGTEIVWGTRPDQPEAKLYEQGNLHPTVTAGGRNVSPRPGETNLPDGEVVATYRLGDKGEKSVTFLADRIRVEVKHEGKFSESIPLLLPAGSKVESSGNRLTVTHGGSSLSVNALTNGASFELGPPTSADDGFGRRSLIISASGNLRYDLQFR
jgi:hypothetical protein